MPLDARLPLLPPNAKIVSRSLAIFEADQRVVLFNAAGAFYTFADDDIVGRRVAAVTAVQQGLAKVAPVARAFHMHRATLFEYLKRFEEHGVDGLMERRRGPKGPHKITPAVRRKAQRLLDGGASVGEAAEQVGVSSRGLRHAIQRDEVADARKTAAEATPIASAVAAGVAEVAECVAVPGPSARAEEDQACVPGVAVKRTLDRVLAATGKLGEAAPQFEAAEGVAGAGVLLALPSLLQQGLLRVGEEVYGSLRNGFFGLRSILLTLAYMALLRIRTPEQLTERAPGELGRLLGLDRAPEVKTLRRKLGEMGERCLADQLRLAFAKEWADAEPEELGILYFDGHVRPYHGRKHSLPKLHVQQRGRPMPGTKDFYVNDRRAQPLFFVTAEATEGLLETLDTVLLPQVRERVGEGRRVRIVFDREGWSPTRFATWSAAGFDVLTYRKGVQSRWREHTFTRVSGDVRGRNVEYRLAERRVLLNNGLKVREIRRLCEDGHQTAVITTDETLPMLELAHDMFSRWTQENFFRYMRQEYAIDHLCTYAVEPANPAREVRNPEHTRIQKALVAERTARSKLIELRATMEPGSEARVGNLRFSEEELAELIAGHGVRIERLEARMAKLPKQVAIGDVLGPKNVVQLERERKILVDMIKHAAYRAESSLARLVQPLFARHEEEARKFLKSIFQSTADLLPDPSQGRLLVRLHGLASPRSTRALAALCAVLNERTTTFPGTSLRLQFETQASE